MLYYVYILANDNNHVIYTGVTNDLSRRVNEHKSGVIRGFTQQYNVHKLVYYEIYNDIKIAIEREKQIKRWARIKKNNLIERLNPEWEELIPDLGIL